jgi:2-polyprenyl-3-methyl-5-hydroxy-6-metoxy-1,4-benzoquinol methylase
MESSVQADALMERVFGARIAAMDVATIHIGRKLGLYEALREVGPLTPPELANRPPFVHQLGSAWIPALPEVHRRLSDEGGRVADVACGAGWASIELARAYAKVTVDGYDLDEPSIALARGNVAGSGVAGCASISATAPIPPCAAPTIS